MLIARHSDTYIAARNKLISLAWKDANDEFAWIVDDSTRDQATARRYFELMTERAIRSQLTSGMPHESFKVYGK